MTIKEFCEKIKPSMQLRIFDATVHSKPRFIEETSAKEAIKQCHESYDNTINHSYLKYEIKKVKWDEKGRFVNIYI